MADRAGKSATYEDVLALGEDVHAEIVAGEIVVHAAPGIDHGFAAGGVTTDLTGPFSRGRGGPGGWWIVPETDVRLPTGDTVRPDLTGWRHTTLPVLPRERPVTTLPDWVCEILSPSNADYDEGEKLALYHAAGVPWVWHVDPERRRRHAPLRGRSHGRRRLVRPAVNALCAGAWGQSPQGKWSARREP